MRLALIAAIVLLVAPAFAQPQPPSAEEQIARTIGNLVMQNAQLQATLAQVQAHLTAAQARVKELEDKAPK